MKPAISSAFILAFVALCGLDASPSPKLEVYVAEAVAKSPLCDCVACKCDPCVCGVDRMPPKVAETAVLPAKTVSTAPVVLELKGGEVQTVQFTQPQPAAKPKPVAAIARPQAVSYGSCGPGGCGNARRGLFGRRR